MAIKVKTLMAAVALLAAIGIYVGSKALAGESTSTKGPLNVGYSGIQFPAAADVGETLTVAAPTLENTGHTVVVIDSVRLLRGGAPFVVERVLIGLPSRKDDGGESSGEPNPQIDGPWTGVQGAQILPVEQAKPHGYSVIFVVHADHLGISWTSGVEVRYHVGGKHFVAKSDFIVKICAPAQKYLDDADACQSNSE